MSENTTDLAASITALQATVETLTRRIHEMEERLGGAARLRIEVREDEIEVRGKQETFKDPFEAFANSVHQRLRENQDQYDQPFGLAVGGIVAMSDRAGSVGTSYSLYTIEKGEDLPDDDKLLARMEEFRPLLADPLVLRIFRHFFALKFAGKRPQATAAELGAALQSPPEQIDTLLQPMVQDQSIRRGLHPDGTTFYTWDGNSHRITAVMFFHR